MLSSLGVCVFQVVALHYAADSVGRSVRPLSALSAGDSQLVVLSKKGVNDAQP